MQEKENKLRVWINMEVTVKPETAVGFCNQRVQSYAPDLSKESEEIAIASATRLVKDAFEAARSEYANQICLNATYKHNNDIAAAKKATDGLTDVQLAEQYGNVS